MSPGRPVRRALLSVSDKNGLVDFARGLAALGIELVATGGTARDLRAAGLALREVADLTGAPEMFAGRVKTLHPAIHAAILARRDRDMAELDRHGIDAIDLVVVNLYPFETVAAGAGAGAGADADEVIEMIDIGGPAMIRAAAKNWKDVAVVCDPADYATVLAQLSEGGLADAGRRRLAAKAFARTAAYDRAIAEWFTGPKAREEPFPSTFQPRFERLRTLRYGENPQQRAALYADAEPATGTVVAARQLQGRTLSFNNLADSDAAWRLVNAFPAPACVIVKHLNPCGVAVAATAQEAYGRAWRCDPASAFGGIVAFNRTLDATSAGALLEQFVEVVIAPDVDDAALALMARKPNLRVLAAGEYSAPAGFDWRRLAGGLLLQETDAASALPPDAPVASRRAPGAEELRDLDFAWRVVQAVRSNAIVLARAGATLGIGGGQTSRVGAVRVAALQAQQCGHELAGCVLASDAFFPFRDNVDVAAGHGVRAIVQPGGSRRDGEVIAAADEHDIAMIFTGERHFRH